MNAQDLRHRLKEIFGEKIEFNRDFDKYSESLGTQASNLLDWCKLVKDGGIRPIPSPKFREGIVFIKKIGSTNRCIVIKLKNREFKEVHLGDHSYYDKLRKILGLKKDSKDY